MLWHRLEYGDVVMAIGRVRAEVGGGEEKREAVVVEYIGMNCVVNSQGRFSPLTS